MTQPRWHNKHIFFSPLSLSLPLSLRAFLLRVNSNNESWARSLGSRRISTREPSWDKSKYFDACTDKGFEDSSLVGREWLNKWRFGCGLCQWRTHVVACWPGWSSWATSTPCRDPEATGAVEFANCMCTRQFKRSYERWALESSYRATHRTSVELCILQEEDWKSLGYVTLRCLVIFYLSSCELSCSFIYFPAKW